MRRNVSVVGARISCTGWGWENERRTSVVGESVGGDDGGVWARGGWGAAVEVGEDGAVGADFERGRLKGGRHLVGCGDERRGGGGAI